ncbi:TPA: chemotaxis protein CheA [Thermoplasmata archaeon]|nr:chemotaxis protein CheA [Thermoplasmata archaeon]
MPGEIDLAKYSKLFVNESREYLRTLNEAMIELEGKPGDKELIEAMFRACHTIKGMAGMMNFKAVTETSHALEDLLNALRNGTIDQTDEVAEAIFRGLDALEEMVSSVERSEEIVEVPGLVEELRGIASATPSRKPAKKRGKKPREKKPEEEPAPKADKAPVAVQSVHVRFGRRCAFPSARALVILKELGKAANIIGSMPTEDEIDQEHVFEEFTINLQPEKGFDEILRRVASMPDAEEVRLGPPDTPVESWKVIQGRDLRPTRAVVEAPVMQTIKVGMNKLDELLDDVSELVIARSRLVERSTAHDDHELEDISTQVDKLTTEIQAKVLGIRMIPLETVMARFPRMVRDIAKSQEKQVELIVDGGNIELDRTVVDRISDPVMHILRNCVDHGIETEQERAEAGKRQRGLIRIVASKQQDHVLIEISDDGRGIDYERIKKKALSKGLFTPDQADSMLARDLLDLLFRPGFSTKDDVSEVSGRGVGLDVVRRNVEELGGTVMISSSKGAGTTFSLWLPFTLAIIDAMLVSIADQIYAVPMGIIAESHRFEVSEIKQIRSREVVQLRGEVLPVIRMRSFFGIPEAEGRADLSALIVQSRERRAALAVDDLMGHQQIVVKSLDARLRRVKGISGGTILGSGKIALILDVDSILGA